jgi:PhzF family phenazine biosynthesis protein
MGVPWFQVDAFTNVPFAGNPAAVCLLELPADPAWMQAVAFEMNLSETAFVVPGDGPFGLRWFTPTVEVDLCGHATLASAHTLFETGTVPIDQPLSFDTRSGRLVCRHVVGPDGAGRVEMDFPETRLRPVEPPAELLDALGVGAAGDVFEAGHWYFVELESPAAVEAVTPATGPGSTSSRASSGPGSASTRTRSRARRTAGSRPTGPIGSGATSWWGTRPPPAVARCGAASRATGCSSPATR